MTRSIIHDHAAIARALRRLQGKPEPRKEPEKTAPTDWQTLFRHMSAQRRPPRSVTDDDEDVF